MQSIFVNNVTLLAIVSVAMTFSVSAGGINLSVGTVVDFASFAFVSLVHAREPVALALLASIPAGACVSAVNALPISAIGVSHFLATLGTLFVGRSIQQLLTNGGKPLLPAHPSGVPDVFPFIGYGTIFSVLVPLVVAGLVTVCAAASFSWTQLGGVNLTIGIQACVVRYSVVGLALPTVLTFILSGTIAAVTGLMLNSTVIVYISSSGNAFLLNAIGASFIGTTLSPMRRLNVAGTVFGVLLLGIVADGVLQSGLNFYRQQVGTGILIFAVLASSLVNKKAGA